MIIILSSEKLRGRNTNLSIELVCVSVSPLEYHDEKSWGWEFARHFSLGALLEATAN